jgi:hypothetical protein
VTSQQRHLPSFHASIRWRVEAEIIIVRRQGDRVGPEVRRPADAFGHCHPELRGQVGGRLQNEVSIPLDDSIGIDEANRERIGAGLQRQIDFGSRFAFATKGVGRRDEELVRARRGIRGNKSGRRARDKVACGVVPIGRFATPDGNGERRIGDSDTADRIAAADRRIGRGIHDNYIRSENISGLIADATVAVRDGGNKINVIARRSRGGVCREDKASENDRPTRSAVVRLSSAIVPADDPSPDARQCVCQSERRAIIAGSGVESAQESGGPWIDGDRAATGDVARLVAQATVKIRNRGHEIRIVTYSVRAGGVRGKNLASQNYRASPGGQIRLARAVVPLNHPWSDASQGIRESERSAIVAIRDIERQQRRGGSWIYDDGVRPGDVARLITNARISVGNRSHKVNVCRCGVRACGVRGSNRASE